MVRDVMIEDEAVKVRIKTICEEIRGFLNGSGELRGRVFRNVLQQINDSQMREVMEKEGFLETEEGKTLLKYFEYMYSNFSDELIKQFLNFPLKYKIFKILNFSAEFVKRDFENNLEIKDKQLFLKNCKYFLKYFENLANEYIENYFLYSDNFLLKLGIIIIIRNINLKNEEEIKKLDTIFVNYIMYKIDKYNINIIFEKHLDNNGFKKYVKNIKSLNIGRIRKYMEKIFFDVIKENESVSKVLFQGTKLLIMVSEVEFSSTNNNYYYKNKIFEKLKKNFEKYSFSQKQKLYLLVNYGMSIIFENFRDSQKMYELLAETIRENSENAVEFIRDNLNEDRISYSFLLHFLIKENLIDERVKDELLEKSEDMMIQKLKEIFDTRVWKWDKIELKNLEFLRKDKNEWENIRVTCLGVKSGNILVSKDKIVFSLLKYSKVYKNIFQFFINCVEGVELFNNIFDRFSIVYEIKDLREILDEMWNYELSINFINKKYFEYIEKSNCNNYNNKIWIEFLHEHEEELYRSFHRDMISEKNTENYVEILYIKNNTFNYNQLPCLLTKSNRNTAYKIEKILKDKQETREEIEKLLKTGIEEIALETAGNLVRYWNNVQARKKLENLSNPRGILEYVESLYLPKHEENAVFSKEIDYHSVRMNDSNEKIPANLLKLYISEYILLNEIKSVEVCNKIEKIVHKGDLRRFVEKIFEKWKDLRFNPKYKNLFIPLILTADMKQLDGVSIIIDILVSEYNKVAVAAYGIRALSLRKEIKETGILIKSFIANYKDKRIKSAANEALDMIAENKGISRDELNDILVPDFGFQNNRVRILDYGTRKIKVEIDAFSNPSGIVIYDENGKKLNMLPKANKKIGDIESIVEKYRREIKYIKKQLKEIYISQEINLIKALFSQRKWKVKKWMEIFIHNPVMQKFAIQLVWEEIDQDSNLVNTFRYSGNRSFLVSDETEHELDSKNNIKLVYFPEISQSETEKWKENFRKNKIIQPISQLNMPIYKITEEKQKNKEIVDYNVKEFSVNIFRKKSPNLGFEINYENNGTGYGSHYLDKETGISILIITSPFFSGEYSKKLKIEKILFLKSDIEICYEKSLESQEIIPLDIKEVPKRLLSLACLMAETLTN
ncbi:DUF4132 domain-containing protein [Leptotrichia sp. HSP-342]|uniref:DUF4132 domain-containing protein n=1 Tax=Leptotrichia mesophila TaxID=3239303 RepID=A0AB39VCY2_9FUSO